MAKLGRPKIKNKRSKNLSWRVTEEEYVRLKEFAAKQNMTISQVLSKGVNLLYQQS